MGRGIFSEGTRAGMRRKRKRHVAMDMPMRVFPPPTLSISGRLRSPDRLSTMTGMRSGCLARLLACGRAGGRMRGLCVWGVSWFDRSLARYIDAADAARDARSPFSGIVWGRKATAATVWCERAGGREREERRGPPRGWVGSHPSTQLRSRRSDAAEVPAACRRRAGAAHEHDGRVRGGAVQTDGQRYSRAAHDLGRRRRHSPRPHEGSRACGAAAQRRRRV